MATQATTTKPAVETAKPEQPKEPKSFGVRLTSGAEQLWLRALRTKTGWRTETIHRVGKKNSRGMTAEHSTADAARAALEKLAVAAIKAGWTRNESRGGGFARKADAFASLPKPGSSKK
jgi:hypothetical protein